MDIHGSLKFLKDKNSNTMSTPMLSPVKNQSLPTNMTITQSATTLTRSVITWSFPKAKRFKPTTNPTKDVPMVDLGSTLSKTATSLGFGKRYTFRPQDTPGPFLTHRELPSVSSKSGTAILSGPVDRQSWDTHREIPGPGSYEIDRGFIRDNKGVCLKSRGNLLNPVKGYPGPNYYSPKAFSVERNRYSAITFGTSKRSDFTKSVAQKFPGPGAYDIVSSFEKKSREFKIKDEQKKYQIKLESIAK